MEYLEFELFLFLLKSVESGPVAGACCLVTLDLILCSRSADGGALVLGCSCQGPIWASGDLCCCCQPHFVTSPPQPHQPSNCGKGSSRNIIKGCGGWKSKIFIPQLTATTAPFTTATGTRHHPGRENLILSDHSVKQYCKVGFYWFHTALHLSRNNGASVNCSRGVWERFRPEWHIRCTVKCAFRSPRNIEPENNPQCDVCWCLGIMRFYKTRFVDFANILAASFVFKVRKNKMK